MLNGAELGASWADSLSTTLTLLVGDSLAAERSKLVLHSVGNKDTDGDEDEDEDQDDRDGIVAFHHFERTQEG